MPTSQATMSRTGQLDYMGNPTFNYSTSSSGSGEHDMVALQMLERMRAAEAARQAYQRDQATLNARAKLQSGGYSGDVSGYGAPQLQQIQQAYEAQQAQQQQEAARAKAINDYWQSQAYKYGVAGLPVSDNPNPDMYRAYLDNAIQQQQAQQQAGSYMAQAAAQGYQISPDIAQHLTPGTYNDYIGTRANQARAYAPIYGAGGDVPGYMQGVYDPNAIGTYARGAIPQQQQANKYNQQMQNYSLQGQQLGLDAQRQGMSIAAAENARAAAAAARQQQQFVQGNTQAIEQVNSRFAQTGRLGSAEHLAALTQLGAANYGTFNR